MRTAGLRAAAFALCAAAATGLSWALAQRTLLGSRWGIVVILAAWVPLWIGGVLLVRRLPARWCLVACAVAAVALRAAAVSGPPALSDDVYRYAWDAKVQLSGTDPYRAAPLDPSLSDLREPWLFPGGPDSDETRINRPTVRTIYPPLAQVWFTTVRVLSGGAAGERVWQVAAAIVDLALCGVLALGLRSLGRDPRLAAWWCLSPLAVVELVQSAHVDGLVALVAVSAVLAASRRHDATAGALVGVAAMLKLYPALLLVPLVARSQHRSRMAAAAAAIGVLSYLPHVLVVGPKVLGYLPGYLREERYDQGGRFLLVRAVTLDLVPGGVVGVLAVALAAGALVWTWRTGRDVVSAAPFALAGPLLVAAPVQPWYAVVAAALGLLTGGWWWAALAAFAQPYYVAVILDSPHAGTIGRAGYAAALVVVAVGMRRHRPGPATLAPTTRASAPQEVAP